MTIIRVKVAPSARADAVIGWKGDTLRVRVRAPAERGKANDAVCRLLAKALALPVGGVKIARGATSRDKTVQLDGIDEAEVRARLAGEAPNAASGASGIIIPGDRS